MPQMETPVETRVEEVLGFLERSATLDYIGEDISQLEHALQCAALAQREEATEEQVIAALLHDLGHFCAPEDAAQMGGYGVADHEEIGAQTLKAFGFSDVVQELVRGHVQAKRYLVTTQDGYASKVSHASQETLKRQGGGMTAEEVEAFEQDPLFREKLRLRWWDDAGKVEDLVVPPLDSYRSLLHAHLHSS